MNDSEPFGWSLALDLYGCDKARLEDAGALRAFTIELCDEVLEMKRFGEPFVEWFGEGHAKTEGYSIVQLIETSSVVGHFSGFRASAHLDVFSCREFSEAAVEKYATEFFGATSVTTNFVVRR